LHGGGRRFDPGILHFRSTTRREEKTVLIFRRILVASDGTEVALRGVAVAADLALQHEAELILMTAVPISQHMVVTSRLEGRTVPHSVERTAAEALSSSIALLKEQRVGAEVRVVIGAPEESVAAEAVSSGADLVVMGRRQRVEPKDLLLGSVSDRVVRRLAIPILLIP
jgi:nucleotide-binding universal stress UspA family protein